MRTRIGPGHNLFSALALIALPGTALGQNEVHVQEWECASPCGSGCTPSALPTDDHDSGDPIIIQVNACTRRINIWTNDADVYHIGRTTIQLEAGASAPSSLELFIGQGDFPSTMQPTTAVAKNFGGTSIVNATLRDVTRFAGHIKGDQADGIEVGRVYRWEVDGNMSAGIIATESPAADQLFRVIIGSASGGIFEAGTGNITLVQAAGTIAGAHIKAADDVVEVIAGELLVGVFAGESIENIDVSGAIGTINTPVNIRTFDTGAPINLIEAASIHANINTGWATTPGAPKGTGDLKRIRTTSGYLKGEVNALDLEGPTGGGSAIDVAGDVLAPVTVKGSVNAPIDIGGDLEADLTVEGSVLAPVDIGVSLLSGKTIKIYGSLSANAPITIGNASGLQGQIIIDGGGGDTNEWSGDVRVGTTTLAPEPHYTNLPGAIGGGAVGEVWFTFHGNASSPQHEAVVEGAPSSVVVDHYGPVFSSSDEPLKVEHRPQGSTEENWTDQTADLDFAIESYPFRRVTITPEAGQSFLLHKEYRVRPQFVSGTSRPLRLKCRYDQNTVDVLYYDYRFTLIPNGTSPLP